MIDYTARPYWVKVLVINANLELAQPAQEVVDHIDDLLVELQHIRGPDYIKRRANSFAAKVYGRIHSGEPTDHG